MYLYQRILHALRRWLHPKREFTLDVNTLESLQSIAEMERITVKEAAGQIVEDAWRRQELRLSGWGAWQVLTPREQEVTALICLYYTNRAIAERLYISPQTVKTHIKNILNKLDLPNRAALREALSELDFSLWE